MRRIVCLGFALLTLAGVCRAQTLTSAQLTRNIHLHGPRAVVQALDRSGRFDAVLDKIASGNAEWIRLAPDIAKGTDAGDSTGLIVALAEALPKNPKAVLRVLDGGAITNASVVCGVPFIEPTPREVAVYLNKAIPAVTRISKSDRFPQREACLEALARAKEEATSPQQ